MKKVLVLGVVGVFAGAVCLSAIAASKLVNWAFEVKPPRD